MIKTDFSSSSLYSFLVIKYFLLFSGLTIFFFSLLSLLIPLGLGNLIFPILFYDYLMWFYFAFFGLLWSPFHYYFFIDLSLFSILLLIFSSLQLLFVYFYSYKGYFPKVLVSVFLLCNLSFIPFGLIAIIFLSKVNLLESQPLFASKAKYTTGLNPELRNLALFFTVGLALNYAVAFAVLNITRVFVIQPDFTTNNFFLVSMAFSLLVAMLVFIAIGISPFDFKRFFEFSLASNVLALITFFTLSLLLNNLYPTINHQINYLGPSSIIIVASCIFFGRMYLFFKTLSREVSSS